MVLGNFLLIKFDKVQHIKTKNIEVHLFKIHF